MTINQAVEFFENVPAIRHKIEVLQQVGLGYIKLGQSSTTLSGGESQRVKLATELSKRDTGQTVYILDEPTTGLHFEDIRVLMEVLQKLVERGNTVIVIEHNLDVIKVADYQRFVEEITAGQQPIEVKCFPLSAKDGDNVVERSERSFISTQRFHVIFLGSMFNSFP